MQKFNITIGGRTYTGGEITIKDDSIFYRDISGLGCVLNINEREFTIKPLNERCFVVVCGKGVGNIWAEHKDMFFEDSETLLQDDLTREQAEELANLMNEARRSYED